MISRWKRIFLYLKEEFSWKAYWILTLILFLITLVRPVYPVKEVFSSYQYQYGIIGSWLTYYQPQNYGMKTLWYHLSHQSLGVLFSPSVILWDSILIYIVYLLLVAAIHGISGHPRS